MMSDNAGTVSPSSAEPDAGQNKLAFFKNLNPLRTENSKAVFTKEIAP